MKMLDSLRVYLSNEFISELETSLSQEPYHAVLLNPSKISDADFLSEFPNLKAHPFVPHCYIYQKDTYGLGKHMLFNLGAYYISEPSAVLVSYLSNIDGNELVLDMCASPGGKTTQTSFNLPQGVIIANDISYKRALVLSSNIERMGLGNVIVTNNDFESIYKKFNSTFDKIILDAPCSGSGMFRKLDKMAEDWSANKVSKCQQEQIKLIKMCYYMLKPGGQLTYSTCSFSFEENEEVISSLLSDSDAYLLPIVDSPYFYRSEIHSEAIHLFPNLFFGEGHYIALIKKPGEYIPTIFVKNQINKKYSSLLESYSMNDRHNVFYNDTLYSLNKNVDVRYLNVLRYGVKAFQQVRKLFEPDHHLSHFVLSDFSISITKEEAIRYLKGEEIKKDAPNGWNIVSYKGVNLGLVKSSNGVLKNHYPKGLRH